MRVLLYMLEAGAGLALFYGIFELFLRKETYFGLNRFYLIAAASLSFAVPALRLTSPFFTAASPAPAVPPLSGLTGPGGFPGLPAGIPEITASRAGGTLPVAFSDILLIVYVAGVLVCLFKRARLLVRLAAFIRRGPVVHAHGLRVVSISEDLSPFSFLGYIFLNERAIDEAERRRILVHESVHVRQLHTLDVLLMELAATLQWFNPFVWPYRKRLQETHEYLADAGVVAQGFDQAEYQLLLLERHVGAGVFEFASHLRQSQIKRRILMLSMRKSRGPSRLKPLLVLPLAALLTLAFAEPRPAASGPAGQEKTASAEKAAQAKRKLEDLKAMESSLLKSYAESESLAKKRDILDKLREILRAEEECAWVITGKPGVAMVQETAADFKAKLNDLKQLEEELLVAAEKAQDSDKKRDYEAKLAEIRRAEKEIQAAAMEHEHAKVAVSATDLEHKLLALKLQEEELRAFLKTNADSARLGKAEELLKQNIVQQKEIMLRLDQVKKVKSEEIR